MVPFYERPYQKELLYNTSRSSGPGGQHVNKTETKVEIRFQIDNSEILSADEKAIIKEKLKNRINSEGFLIVTAQEHRSQLKNKELAEHIFVEIISKALKKRKRRIATKPSKRAKEKRIQVKKIISDKKSRRSKPVSGEE